MKRLTIILLVLLLLAGCSKVIPCDEYVVGTAQLTRAAKAFPEHSELLNQCVQVATLSSQLCIAGQPVDPTLYQRCMAAAQKLAEAAQVPQVPQGQPQENTPPPGEHQGGANDSGQPGALKDDIDISDVTWLGDLRYAPGWPWPATHNLQVSLRGNDIYFAQTATSEWKPVNGMVGNPIAIVWKDAKKHGFNWEWFVEGAKVRSKSYLDGGHAKVFDVFPESWKPAPGDKVCLSVGALNRGRWEGEWYWDRQKIRERTVFRCITWE